MKLYQGFWTNKALKENGYTHLVWFSYRENGDTVKDALPVDGKEKSEEQIKERAVRELTMVYRVKNPKIFSKIKKIK